MLDDAVVEFNPARFVCSFAALRAFPRLDNRIRSLNLVAGNERTSGVIGIPRSVSKVLAKAARADSRGAVSTLRHVFRS